MKPQFIFVAAPISAALVSQGFAVTYLNVEQAQNAIFPGKTLNTFPLNLSAAQCRQIEQESRVRLTSRPPRIWRVNGGGWFIVDEVIGKHEFITYAIGLTSEGTVCGIEIMDYRESYGGQVRDPKWRAQFIGKTKAAPLILDRDIKNISGATLSSRHLTDGVRRVLTLHDVALR
jgi:Na+-translocating ferredoxin:NAD+ oxidoreductase RnfG subunit